MNRRVTGSSDVPATGDKQSNSSSRQSLASSLPRGPVHHHTLSSSTSDNNEDPVEPTAQLSNKIRYRNLIIVYTNLMVLFSITDLTELDETAEMESRSSRTPSQDKQATCPVCQQLFSEAYIATHTAYCELHVDGDDDDNNKGRTLTVPSSSKLHQTTLTHKPLNTNTHRKRVIESDSDFEVVCIYEVHIFHFIAFKSCTFCKIPNVSKCYIFQHQVFDTVLWWHQIMLVQIKRYYLL